MAFPFWRPEKLLALALPSGFPETLGQPLEAVRCHGRNAGSVVSVSPSGNRQGLPPGCPGKVPGFPSCRRLAV